MSNIINGYSYPRFRILTSSDVFVEEIDLDFTNSGGLIETYKDEDITHVLEKNKEIVKVYRGKKRIIFTLHYDEFIKKENSLKIQSILEYENNGYKIILIPRSDVLSRSFQVVYSGEDFELGINRGGAFANSNKSVIMKWTSKRLEKINWVDIDNIYVPLDFAIV